MKILNFGSLNIDKVCQVQDFVQPGETILALDYNTFCGGKGLNQSVALARAGADTYHAGAIGNDGKMLKDMLSLAGAHLDFVQELDCASGQAMIEVNANGQNRIIVCPGSNAMITKEFVDEVLSHFEKGDILLLQNEINNIPYIMEAASKIGMQIAVNPSPINPLLLETYPLNLASFLIVNETEGQLLCGLDAFDEQKILDSLTEKYPNAAIIMTLGSKGAYYKDKNTCFFQPACKVKAVDTTAAGDTFCGYLLANLSSGKTPQEAMETATHASAIAVSREGAAPSIPSAAEVAAFQA